jgi:hypothetical protein
MRFRDYDKIATESTIMYSCFTFIFIPTIIKNILRLGDFLCQKNWKIASFLCGLYH